MGANDHRTRVTRMMIRKAFTSLLQQKPIQSISVKELCTVAGISRGTFYSHYTDIYDLMGQMEDELMEEVRRGLGKMLEGDPGEPSLLKVTEGLFCSLQEPTYVRLPWGLTGTRSLRLGCSIWVRNISSKRTVCIFPTPRRNS